MGQDEGPTFPRRFGSWHPATDPRGYPAKVAHHDYSLVYDPHADRWWGYQGELWAVSVFCCVNIAFVPV
jgi:hypothetical protein